VTRHRGRHSRGAGAGAPDGAPCADGTSGAPRPGTEASSSTSTTAGDTTPGLADHAVNGTAVTIGSLTGTTLAAVLDVAPDLSSPSGVTPAPTTLVAHHGSHVGSHHGAHLAAPPDETPHPHRRWPWVTLLVVVVVVAGVGVQLSRPVPTLAVHRAALTAAPVAGATPALPWPATGEAAVAVPRLGVDIKSGPEAPVPIASLTKIMTAYVILRDHPLALGATGPVLMMTAADQAEAATESAAGATNVPVQAGEKLDERQLLDGLLVHSANNLADVLARWDAGTVPAFVAKMNTTAAALGMPQTHYADSSGLDPATAGTAGDELRVTEAAMAIPVFAAIVAQPSVTLPVAGVMENYVKSVGTGGIVGVKSGFTAAAMGCLVLAARRTVSGLDVLVLAVVTGQPGEDPLDTANQADEQLIDAVASGLRQVPVTSASVRVASVTIPWSHQRVPLVARRSVAVLAWPGQVPRLAVTTRSLRVGMKAGTAVGTLSVSVDRERVIVPVRVSGSLVGPSVSWRLARS